MNLDIENILSSLGQYSFIPNIENILSSLGQYSFIPNKKSINILFDEAIKSQESCNYYFKNFPKSIEWKENFTEEEKKEIYVDVIKKYHLNIKKNNLIKLSNEIFNEIKGDKKKFDEYFKEYNKQVELKESFDNKNTDNIKKLIQSIENERIEENEKKVNNALKNIDIFNKYLENSGFTLKNDLYSYNISEKEYVRGKIIDEEIEKRYLNDNELINSIRRIINIQNNQEIKIDLAYVNDNDVKELAKLDSLKLDIISKINDLNIIIDIIENKINEFNYKDYGLNEVKEDEINFFKLDPVRLFMILIYEELICKEEQNESKFNFLTNQFLNEKTLALAKINYLNWVIEQLNESGKEEFVREFFNFDNKKIELLGKIINLGDVIEELNGSGGATLVREFLTILKENDLDIINKMLFDDNCKQKDNSKIVEFISSFEKKTTFNLKKVENHSMKGNNIV